MAYESSLQTRHESFDGDGEPSRGSTVVGRNEEGDEHELRAQEMERRVNVPSHGRVARGLWKHSYNSGQIIGFCHMTEITSETVPERCELVSWQKSTSGSQRCTIKNQ